MTKVVTFFILFMIILRVPAFSQNTSKDSLTAAAKTDVKRFRLSDKNMKIYRADKGNYSSDLFKPTAANVANPSLLTDSVFVKAFREGAYKKTRKRRTTGHYILLGLEVFAALQVIAFVVVLGVILHDFN